MTFVYIRIVVESLSVLDEFVKPMYRTRKTLHPRHGMFYHWEITFARTIHCVGEHVFLTHRFNFFHDEIGNEGPSLMT